MKTYPHLLLHAHMGANTHRKMPVLFPSVALCCKYCMCICALQTHVSHDHTHSLGCGTHQVTVRSYQNSCCRCGEECYTWPLFVSVLLWLSVHVYVLVCQRVCVWESVCFPPQVVTSGNTELANFVCEYLITSQNEGNKSNNHLNRFTTCNLLPLFENWNIKHWNYLMSTSTHKHLSKSDCCGFAQLYISYHSIVLIRVIAENWQHSNTATPKSNGTGKWAVRPSDRR